MNLITWGLFTYPILASTFDMMRLCNPRRKLWYQSNLDQTWCEIKFGVTCHYLTSITQNAKSWRIPYLVVVPSAQIFKISYQVNYLSHDVNALWYIENTTTFSILQIWKWYRKIFVVPKSTDSLEKSQLLDKYFKPPKAALVKSQGSERLGKVTA